MGKEVRVALVGARRAMGFLGALKTHPETTVVALCDIDEHALAQASEKVDMARLYTVYEKMLDEAKPDAVVVATPMPLHVPQAHRRFAAGHPRPVGSACCRLD